MRYGVMGFSLFFFARQMVMGFREFLWAALMPFGWDLFFFYLGNGRCPS